MERELGDVRRKLEEVEGEREAVRGEMEGVRRESGEEVRRWREEAERARDTLTQEKESFDAQVTELCGMLERYRNENQKIVQQRELQIQSLQSSLTSSRERQASTLHVHVSLKIMYCHAQTSYNVYFPQKKIVLVVKNKSVTYCKYGKMVWLYIIIRRRLRRRRGVGRRRFGDWSRRWGSCRQA